MAIPVWLVVPVFLAGFLVGLLAAQRADRSHAVIPPRSPAELDAQVRALVSVGKTIQAIKLYREYHHVDLKDAKDIIDAIERGDVTLPS